GLGGLDGIRDHQLLQPGSGDAADRSSGKHAVGDVGVDFAGAFLQQGVGRVHHGAAGINDVVDENADAALDLADNAHHFRLAYAPGPLADNGKRSIDALREPPRSSDSADIGRDHHDLAQIETFADIAHHHGRGIEVVSGNIEESLYLASVQIQRHDPVRTG